LTILFKEEDLNFMINELILTINNEIDTLKKEEKYIESIQIKRHGKNLVVSFWHGKRFKTKADVKKIESR